MNRLVKSLSIFRSDQETSKFLNHFPLSFPLDPLRDGTWSLRQRKPRYLKVLFLYDIEFSLFTTGNVGCDECIVQGRHIQTSTNKRCLARFPATFATPKSELPASPLQVCSRRIRRIGYHLKKASFKEVTCFRFFRYEYLSCKAVHKGGGSRGRFNPSWEKLINYIKNNCKRQLTGKQCNFSKVFLTMLLYTLIL